MGLHPDVSFCSKTSGRQSRERCWGHSKKAVVYGSITLLIGCGSRQRTSEQEYHTGECSGDGNTVTTHRHRDINEYNDMKREMNGRVLQERRVV